MFGSLDMNIFLIFNAPYKKTHTEQITVFILIILYLIALVHLEMRTKKKKNNKIYRKGWY